MFLKPDRKYRWFLLALSISDWMLCAVAAVQAMISANYHTHGTSSSVERLICRYVGVSLYTFGLITIIVQPLLVLNRYISLYHQPIYGWIYRPLNIAFMIASTFLMGFLCYLGNAIEFDQDENATTSFYDLCLVNWESPINRRFFFYKYFPVIFASLSYLILIYCNVMIFVKLKRHHRKVSCTLYRTMIAENQQLVKASALQATIPFLFHIPPIVVARLAEYFDLGSGAIHLAYLTFVLNSIIDPAIILWVVRPYRDATARWLIGLSRCRCVIAPTLTTAERARHSFRRRKTV